MRSFLYIFVLFFTLSYSQTGNIGINTNLPEQKLHLGGVDATMCVSSLNSVNDLHNSGSINAPLYVNSTGEYTLDLNLLLFDPESDGFDGNSPASFIYQIGQGYKTQELYTKTITVTRASYLEIKYNLSFQVSLDIDNSLITDSYARLIQNYVLLNYGTRKYGSTSKCYINSDLDGVNATYYNTAEMYIFLSAGTHIISFYGTVGSDTDDDTTFVNFGLDKDLLLMRLY